MDILEGWDTRDGVAWWFLHRNERFSASNLGADSTSSIAIIGTAAATVRRG